MGPHEITSSVLQAWQHIFEGVQDVLPRLENAAGEGPPLFPDRALCSQLGQERDLAPGQLVDTRSAALLTSQRVHDVPA